MMYPKIIVGKFNIGQFMQLLNAFLYVKEALSFFIDSYSQIAELVAVIRRLEIFIKRIEISKNNHVKVNKMNVDSLKCTFAYKL